MKVIPQRLLACFAGCFLLSACGGDQLLHTELEGEGKVARTELRYRPGRWTEGSIYLKPGESYKQILDISLFGPLRPEMTPEQVEQLQEPGLTRVPTIPFHHYELTTNAGHAAFYCEEVGSSAGGGGGVSRESVSVWVLKAHPGDKALSSWIPKALLPHILQNPNGDYSWMNQDGTTGIEVEVRHGEVERIGWLFDDLENRREWDRRLCSKPAFSQP